MANDFKTAQPLEFYKQFLKEHIRPDGRGLLEFRKTLLNVGSISTADGSALLRLGNTMVVCGIKADLAEPSVEHPAQGFFVPNVDLPALCSPVFRPGPPSEKAQVLSQFVADTVTNSGLIKLEDLCIEEKKLCWVLYADIICVSNDGNLADAAITALYAALKNTKLPVIKINEETGIAESVDDKKFELNLTNQPVSTTVALFHDSVLLVDPTHEEEELSSGTITVVVGTNQQLCAVYKPGGYPIKEEFIKSCVQAALNRAEEVSKLLSEVNEEVDRCFDQQNTKESHLKMI